MHDVKIHKYVYRIQRSRSPIPLLHSTGDGGAAANDDATVAADVLHVDAGVLGAGRLAGNVAVDP